MGTIDIQILNHREIDRQRWDEFIIQSPQGSLYALYDYATLIRDDWKGIIARQNGEWAAVMPFCINRKWGYTYMPQPMFTQYWGICFAPEHTLSSRKHLSWKEEIMSAILPSLRPFHLIVQNFAPQFDYATPLHWEGFRLQTRYTYHLDLGQEVGELRKQLSTNVRRNISKAEKSGLVVCDLPDGGALENLFRRNRDHGHNIAGNEEANYQKAKEICNYLLKSGLGKIVGIQNPEGEIIAAAAFAFFGEKTLYLMGAYHPDHGDSGAGSLLMWQGILLAKEKNQRIFDFEGSMMPGVEHFFRKFGAIPVPYLQIYKNRLPLILKWIQELRSSEKTIRV
ncbi:MAG: GNAT family N-acetyltransferase [Bacteroidia bacterium]